MSWTEHQRAMLAEMGLRVWDAPAAVEPVVATAPAPLIANARPTHRAVDVVAPVAPPPRTAVPQAPVTAPASAVATMDWPALRTAVAACTACSLHQSRRQTVFGVGHPQAHWMIVGEAPGEEEDLRGEPFVGRSGQLLGNMLRSIGLSRQAGTPSGSGESPATPDPARQVYIANTLKCRPPGNRNPLPDELARCEGFLIRQIELVQPKIILAMGRFAVQSLLRSSAPIGQLRGRVHAYQGVPLVVTYHPAYLLRNLPEKARAWDDLCLAQGTVDAAAARAASDP